MSMLYRDPCVFVVGQEYQIAFNTTEFGVAWVEVGDKTYRSSRNGLMLSETLIHKVSVPMQQLDQARKYRICFRALPERKPYFPQLGELQTVEYSFRPIVAGQAIRACMLADTHSRVEEPTRAARQLGEIDLLILNGDIPAESKTYDDIRAIYDLTSNVAHGEIPVVFARGNHDYRGRLATDLPDYIGTQEGHTWFTFRMGSLWGIVLDCGEDKEDTSIEYGGMVDCHDMRLAETEYIRKVIANAQDEYFAPGITTRIAITHVPFPIRQIEDSGEIFNIEVPLFTEWTRLLNEMRLDMMLCGHMHDAYAILPNTCDMRMPANFPVIVGSAVHHEKRPCPLPGHPNATYICAGLKIDETIEITLSDDRHQKTSLYQK